MRLVVPARGAQRHPALPDRRSVERPGARWCGSRAMAREEGVEEVVIGLTYSISPVAHARVLRRARRGAGRDCADIDRLYLKDPGGLLTPDAVRELRPQFLAAVAPRPVELHSHCTIGLGAAGLRRGPARRASGRCTPRSRRWRSGTSNPPRRDDAAQPRGRGLLARARPRGAGRRVRALPRARARARACRSARRAEYDAAYYRHQMPGGMVTTTRRMLEEMRRPELFDAVLEEVTRVRAEMGYPIMVTPVLAVRGHARPSMNVIGGERWRDVSDEIVRYFLGHFGAPAAPVDPEVADRVLSLPRAAELRDARAAQPRGRARALRRADLRGGAAAAADDAGRAGRRDGRPRRGEPAPRRRPARARPAGRAAAASWPSAQSITYLRVEKGDDLVGVAPCGLTTSAASCSTSTGRWCTAAPTSGRQPLPGARGGAGGDPRRRAGRWCCSPTAATSRRRSSRAGCARTGCRSPTTRC